VRVIVHSDTQKIGELDHISCKLNITFCNIVVAALKHMKDKWEKSNIT
jgi:hypothetical protein